MAPVSGQLTILRGQSRCKSVEYAVQDARGSIARPFDARESLGQAVRETFSVANHFLGTLSQAGSHKLRPLFLYRFPRARVAWLNAKATLQIERGDRGSLISSQGLDKGFDISTDSRRD